MTADSTPSTRPNRAAWPWVAVGGALAILGIGILWPLQQVGQICIEIYPSPPGCFAEEPRRVPLVGMGLVLVLLAVQVVVMFTAARPQPALILLTVGIVVVVAAAAGVVALSQTGIWDPVQPIVPVPMN